MCQDFSALIPRSMLLTMSGKLRNFNIQGDSNSMKRFIIALFVVGLMSSMALAAEDGAAIYKAKCAMCHGPDGAGKSGPALKGQSAAAVTAVLNNGGKKAPHTKGMAALTADQMKAVSDYVATLK